MTSKLGGKHTSCSKEMKAALQRFLNLSFVKKMVLGIYSNCRHKYAPGHVHFQADTTTGIKLKAYDGSGVRDVFLYINPIEMREELKKELGE